ncbi:hypothetical protein TNCV_3117781 [Trichonephila clavipes]|uniref:WAP domain-containing protein n=1 Tax=Trichonephila clavipes TaxID=2585209 RepID=A0A8X7BGB8_TRICX|nr:hypothetical protein TNCV_3117781 [Trichonephila clavipes]
MNFADIYENYSINQKYMFFPVWKCPKPPPTICFQLEHIYECKNGKDCPKHQTCCPIYCGHHSVFPVHSFEEAFQIGYYDKNFYSEIIPSKELSEKSLNSIFNVKAEKEKSIDTRPNDIDTDDEVGSKVTTTDIEFNTEDENLKILGEKIYNFFKIIIPSL